MELYPVGHPSARHSRIDWSKAYDHWRDSERPFARTQVNEVVLQAGDILYLPTHWFHFIVSLNTTHQCNSRSGVSYDYQLHIDQCGFGKNNPNGEGLKGIVSGKLPSTMLETHRKVD
jgi:Cupin-like domain